MVKYTLTLESAKGRTQLAWLPWTQFMRDGVKLYYEEVCSGMNLIPACTFGVHQVHARHTECYALFLYRSQGPEG